MRWDVKDEVSVSSAKRATTCMGREVWLQDSNGRPSSSGDSQLSSVSLFCLHSAESRLPLLHFPRPGAERGDPGSDRNGARLQRDSL